MALSFSRALVLIAVSAFLTQTGCAKLDDKIREQAATQAQQNQEVANNDLKAKYHEAQLALEKEAHFYQGLAGTYKGYAGEEKVADGTFNPNYTTYEFVVTASPQAYKSDGDQSLSYIDTQRNALSITIFLRYGRPHAFTGELAGSNMQSCNYTGANGAGIKADILNGVIPESFAGNCAFLGIKLNLIESQTSLPSSSTVAARADVVSESSKEVAGQLLAGELEKVSSFYVNSTNNTQNIYFTAAREQE